MSLNDNKQHLRNTSIGMKDIKKVNIAKILNDKNKKYNINRWLEEKCDDDETVNEYNDNNNTRKDKINKLIDDLNMLSSNEVYRVPYISSEESDQYDGKAIKMKVHIDGNSMYKFIYENTKH
jgi:hypothetical protein